MSQKMGKSCFHHLLITVIMCMPSITSFTEYEFEVFPVQKCPVSKESWEIAAAELKCNRTQGYHCVPNANYTSLIQFCYPRGYKIPVEKGNCLQLQQTSILNYVSCYTFSGGCPDKFYFSNDIFKFSKCLEINTNLQCFDADVGCNFSRVLKTMTNQTEYNSTFTFVGGIHILHPENHADEVLGHRNERNYSKCNQTAFAINQTDNNPYLYTAVVLLAVISCSFTFAITIFLILVMQRKRRLMKEKCEKGNLITLPCFDFIYISLAGMENFSKDTRETKRRHSNEKLLHDQPTYISNGNTVIDTKSLRNFVAEIKSEELKKQGMTNLHIATKVDNLSIFRAFLGEDDTDETTVDGQNILHLAAHYGSYSICNLILKHYEQLFSCVDNQGLNSAHLAARSGHPDILDLMFQHDCDLSKKTETRDQNIVHLACEEGRLKVCKFVASTEKIVGLLHEKDYRDWNSIQYAAKNGHLEIIKFLLKCNVDVKNETKNGMNCLHLGCDGGHFKVCEFLLSKVPELITKADKTGLHAGHIAAKNGHTDILQLLINTNEKAMRKSTFDGVNILHMACRAAHYDICKIIIKRFPSMVKKITKNGRNAAHYITEGDDSEEERMKILHLVVLDLDLNHVTESGETVLGNAQKNKLSEICKFLMENSKNKFIPWSSTD